MGTFSTPSNKDLLLGWEHAVLWNMQKKKEDHHDDEYNRLFDFWWQLDQFSNARSLELPLLVLPSNIYLFSFEGRSYNR